MIKLQNLVAARRRQKGYSLKISMEPGGSGYLRENENMQKARTNWAWFKQVSRELGITKVISRELNLGSAKAYQWGILERLYRLEL